MFPPAPGAAAGTASAQGSARLLLQVGTARGQPELLPATGSAGRVGQADFLWMVGDCSPQLPVSNCKPIAFGMIQNEWCTSVQPPVPGLCYAEVCQCERRFIGTACPAGSQSWICHAFLLSEHYKRMQHMPSPGPQHASMLPHYSSLQSAPNHTVTQVCF